ncbi:MULTISPECIES: nitrate reductase [Kordiimonas]|jgi:assimilatory nitrate reductase catalytic subunit|uniref:nitrate reductase n=1 Tax=Kordiimonas TaxID=288021 RepID=UPI00257BD6CD|nr:nitrate reductase [Kordiimonas sp. UBA4487]
MTTRTTTCAYCGVGCGVQAVIGGDRLEIKGDPEHPANAGRLCSKGLALGDTLDSESRLKAPIVDGSEVPWPTAVEAVASRLKATIDEFGPDAVAFYVSGQLLTEDYYVANKLMKGFIGSGNIDTNSRLCMSSAVAGHKRAFGADIVPGDYTDFDEADLVVLTGSNLAWCHPVLFQRLKAAKEKRGTKIVVIDPRRTETCDIADLHIPIMPGGDTLLFGGLLAHLDATGAAPTAYTHNHVDGYDEAIEAAKADLEKLTVAAQERGIEEEINAFFDLFAKTEKVVTLYSMGVNQAKDGTDRVNAIVNCHLATGRIGRPGTGPFSMTGQPNAMGGREVGGLANMLAAHMDFTPEATDRVARFWDAPNMATKPGRRAVDMFDAIHDGRIKAVWIMATNPAVSMPNACKVREALSRCPTVIVSDCVADTDTQKYAHIRLPAQGWSEKDGTVTNSDRTISRQRGFRAPVGEARADWQIMTAVAQAMGWGEAFPYTHPVQIFREHAALTAFENGGSRPLDLGAFADINSVDYETLAPTKWPFPKGAEAPQKRLFADGIFPTPNRKARMIAVRHQQPVKKGADGTLLLNTGRYRDQWHTMTRTGLAHKLTGHRAEPLLDIHPRDAARLAIADKAFVSVRNDRGSATVRARITTDQAPGEVFLPMHWNDQCAADARTGSLIAPIVDPHSAQPAFKATPVRVQALQMAWKGLLFSRSALTVPSDYWSRTKLESCLLTRLAGKSFAQIAALQDTLLEGADEWLEMGDAGTGSLRLAFIRGGQLDTLLFVGEDLCGVNIDWLSSLFTGPLDDRDRQLLLAGRSRGMQFDKGPIVCSCYQVGRKQIAEAVKAQGLCSVDAIGRTTAAGTGCGSCIPELKALLPTPKKEKEAVDAA